MKRFLILFVVVAAVIAMVLANWLDFDTDNNSASVTLNTDEVVDDTKKALKTGGEAIEGAADEVRDATLDEANPDAEADVEIDIKDNTEQNADQ